MILCLLPDAVLHRRRQQVGAEQALEAIRCKALFGPDNVRHVNLIAWWLGRFWLRWCRWPALRVIFPGLLWRVGGCRLCRFSGSLSREDPTSLLQVLHIDGGLFE